MINKGIYRAIEVFKEVFKNIYLFVFQFIYYPFFNFDHMYLQQNLSLFNK